MFRRSVAIIAGVVYFCDGERLASRSTGSDLRGSGSVQTGGLQMLPDLLATQAVGFEVLARVTLDLRRPVLLDVDLVTELPQAQSEFRTVHRGAILLRPEYLVWLH